MGWDDWNDLLSDKQPRMGMAQPPQAGMIETPQGIGFGKREIDPANMGWDDWNSRTVHYEFYSSKTQPAWAGMIETIKQCITNGS